ncbi:hypothetical protein ACP275_06G123900 [Erythranthe tilingii]
MSVPRKTPPQNGEIFQTPFQNSFAPSPSMQQSSVPNSSSSQQPHVSQSTFENPFSQQPASQPALLHGPNGALFQRSKTTRVGGSKSTAVGGSKRTTVGGKKGKTQETVKKRPVWMP